MDNLIYLFLLLILFINSINTKLLLISIFCFLGICIYFKKNQLLIIGLALLYILSLFNNRTEGFDTTSSTHHHKEVPTTHHHDSEHNKHHITEQSLQSLQSNGVPKVKDRHEVIVLTPSNYSEIYYVLSSLLDTEYLESNKESIEEVIINNGSIKDIFTLSDSILNVKNDKQYNNFLEKITCRKNGSVDYLDCDNINSNKLVAFSQLINIYTFSIEYVLKLINKEKIYKLCDVENFVSKLQNNNQYGYEYYGYQVYINKLDIHSKYYKLLELLGLDTLLHNQNINIPIKDRLYNYVDKEVRLSKDLNSLVILFNYYKILDEIRINNEEDDYNWDYSLLRNINLNRNYWSDNPFFVKYKIKNIIIEKINEMTKEDKDIFRHELNNKYVSEGSEGSEGSNINEESQDLSEYKVVKSNNGEKSLEFLEKLNLKDIKFNFSKVFLDIIKEIVELYTHRCKNNCNTYKNEYINTIMYYLNNIIKIFIKEGRMFYVGILIIFISFMLYFIEVSK